MKNLKDRVKNAMDADANHADPKAQCNPVRCVAE